MVCWGVWGAVSWVAVSVCMVVQRTTHLKSILAQGSQGFEIYGFGVPKAPYKPTRGFRVYATIRALYGLGFKLL